MLLWHHQKACVFCRERKAYLDGDVQRARNQQQVLQAMFKKATSTVWICLNCGHIHYGETAPLVCPVCNHPQAYFEIKKENY